MTALKSPTLVVAAWAEWEGTKWFRRPGETTAWWVWCLDCHRDRRGEDGRQPNRRSGPVPEARKRIFYITDNVSRRSHPGDPLRAEMWGPVPETPKYNVT